MDLLALFEEVLSLSNQDGVHVSLVSLEGREGGRRREEEGGGGEGGREEEGRVKGRGRDERKD